MNYQKYLSKTVMDIPPSGIRKFFDLADKDKEVISLGVGEPDFNPGAQAKRLSRAFKRALRNIPATADFLR